MKKYIVIFFAMFLILSCSESKKNNPSPQQKKETSFLEQEPYAIYAFNLTEKIDEAKKMLIGVKAGYEMKNVRLWKWVLKKDKKGKAVKDKKGKAKRVKYYWTKKVLSEYNTFLAICDTQTQKIQLVKIFPDGDSKPEGFKVTKESGRGVNREHEVTYPKGYIVLALKRVLSVKGQGYTEVIYTPYSEELNTLELRKQGLEYLKNSIEQAQKKLKERKVYSKAFPKKFVADIVPVDVALQLAIIEHVDPFEFEKAKTEEEIIRLVNKTLVSIGANRESAYKYAVSKAGARGLFQFIPNTYSRIWHRYPKAKLNPQFVKGMNDHINAAMTSLLLFDSDLAVLSRSHKQSISEDSQALGMYLAAAYNGGASRARNAINKHGTNWTENVLKETVTYIDKFVAVSKYQINN